MSIVLQSSGGGSVTVQEPTTASNFTQTLPAGTGTVVVSGINSAITAASAQTASSTSVDFTSIPSWVRRITVMMQGVSTNGTSNILIQLGTGATPTYTTSGYSSIGVRLAASLGAATTSTAGFIVQGAAATDTLNGNMILCLVTGNTWSESSTFQLAGTANATFGGGAIALGGTLTAVRITTVNGTDTFDAGTINILYE
jgi:hypothetical protein